MLTGNKTKKLKKVFFQSSEQFDLADIFLGLFRTKREKAAKVASVIFIGVKWGPEIFD